MDNYFIKPEAEQAKVFYTIKPLEWSDGVSTWFASQGRFSYMIQDSGVSFNCSCDGNDFRATGSLKEAKQHCQTHYEQQLLQHLIPAITLDKPAN